MFQFYYFFLEFIVLENVVMFFLIGGVVCKEVFVKVYEFICVVGLVDWEIYWFGEFSGGE